MPKVHKNSEMRGLFPKTRRNLHAQVNINPVTNRKNNDGDKIMSELNAKEYKRFEEIKRIRADGGEYWLARKNSGFDIGDHFAGVSKMVGIGIR